MERLGVGEEGRVVEPLVVGRLTVPEGRLTVPLGRAVAGRLTVPEGRLVELPVGRLTEVEVLGRLTDVLLLGRLTVPEGRLTELLLGRLMEELLEWLMALLERLMEELEWLTEERLPMEELEL